jgi:DNA-binding CsgD family transcriptional regulator
MLSGSRVLIVSQNRLTGIGLRAVLQDCFSPASVRVDSTLDPTRLSAYDYIFLSVHAYIRYHTALATTKAPVIVLTDEHHPAELHRYPLVLWTGQSESAMIEDLDRLQSRARPSLQARTSNLSAREVEVLKLVARGHINKHIADALSISLHTVISHRKNITGKLGIKTVSGLTMYAVLNGLISSKDIG